MLYDVMIKLMVSYWFVSVSYYRLTVFVFSLIYYINSLMGMDNDYLIFSFMPDSSTVFKNNTNFYTYFCVLLSLNTMFKLP